MAKGKTEKPPLATPGETSLAWERVKIAEDELSELWHETAKIENSEQASEAARETQIDQFWPSIEKLANRCDLVLQEHGFPPAAEMVRHDGAGKWWRPPLDGPKRPPTGETWKFTRGNALAQEFSDDFSDAWYAGRLGFQCRLALLHHQNGDDGKPFLFSIIFHIATLRKDWIWRRGQKASILTGKPVRKGAKLGGEMRAGKFRPQTSNIIEEMRRLINNGQSISRAAELVASNGLGKNKEANRALWKRHRNR